MTAVALVTGGAGFIGSHLVDRLLTEGREVHVVDDLSSGDAARVPGGAMLHEVDIVDRGALDAVFDTARPQTVFHLGAQSSVVVSVNDPGRDCAVNVQGTLNVLEGAQRHNAPIVFTSTGGALYGDDAPLPTAEDRLPAPLAPYGASKWAGEAYVATWAAKGGLPHAICRLGNVYGPRQSPHGEAGVVAIFTNKLLKGETPTLFGHGAPTRDYVHVQDVAAALCAASGTRGVFNIATGVETDVLTLLALLQQRAGTSVEPDLQPLREGELQRSCLDTSRAADVLGWRAAVDIESGLASTFTALAAELATD